MSDAEVPATPSHPEEMLAEAEIEIGRFVTLRAKARTTPAGLVCTAILVSSILLSVGWVIIASKRRPV